VTAGPAPAEARRVAVLVHGRNQDPGYMLEHLVAPLDLPDVAYVLPAAAGGSWYPGRFNEPRERNEPWLSHALDAVDHALAGLPAERVVLAGFSQGGCLVADLLARTPRPYAGAAVLTGALIGSEGDATEVAPLAGLPVYMETSRYDGLGGARIRQGDPPEAAGGGSARRARGGGRPRAPHPGRRRGRRPGAAVVSR